MNQQQEERIEAYLLGKLPKSAAQKVKTEIEGDRQLREELVDHQKMMQAIEEVGFREMLQDIHVQGGFDQPKPFFGFQTRWIWGIAAVFVLLIGLVGLLQEGWQDDPITFADAYLELDPGLPTPLGLSQQLNFWEGMNAYKLEDYVKAEAYWNPLLSANPQNDTLMFFLGQTALALGENQQAIQRLSMVEQQSDSPFEDKARWYLALAYLRLENMETSQNLLESIIQKNSPWAEKARSLLAEIQQSRFSP